MQDVSGTDERDCLSGGVQNGYLIPHRSLKAIIFRLVIALAILVVATALCLSCLPPVGERFVVAYETMVADQQSQRIMTFLDKTLDSIISPENVAAVVGRPVHIGSTVEPEEIVALVLGLPASDQLVGTLLRGILMSSFVILGLSITIISFLRDAGAVFARRRWRRTPK